MKNVRWTYCAMIEVCHPIILETRKDWCKGGRRRKSGVRERKRQIPSSRLALLLSVPSSASSTREAMSLPPLVLQLSFLPVQLSPLPTHLLLASRLLPALIPSLIISLRCPTSQAKSLVFWKLCPATSNPSSIPASCLFMTSSPV